MPPVRGARSQRNTGSVRALRVGPKGVSSSSVSTRNARSDTCISSAAKRMARSLSLENAWFDPAKARFWSVRLGGFDFDAFASSPNAHTQSFGSIQNDIFGLDLEHRRVWAFPLRAVTNKPKSGYSVTLAQLASHCRRQILVGWGAVGGVGVLGTPPASAAGDFFTKRGKIMDFSTAGMVGVERTRGRPPLSENAG